MFAVKRKGGEQRKLQSLIKTIKKIKTVNSRWGSRDWRAGGRVTSRSLREERDEANVILFQLKTHLKKKSNGTHIHTQN